VDKRLREPLEEGGYTFEILENEIRSSGDEAWFYYNKHNSYDLEAHRVTNGLYFWNSIFTHHYPWAYQWFFGDPFNESDDICSDVAYAYPDPENNYLPTLPTLKWEAFREGADDIRYLYILEQKIRENENNPERQEEVQAARALVQEIKDKINQYGPDERGIRSGFELEDYQNYRYRIAKKIIELKPAEDVNGDEAVDMEDVLVLSLVFGKRNRDEGWDENKDVVRNGIIDIYDLVYVLSRLV